MRKRIIIMVTGLLCTIMCSACSLGDKSEVALLPSTLSKEAITSGIFREDRVTPVMAELPSYQVSYVNALLNQITVLESATQGNIMKARLSWVNYNDLLSKLTKTAEFRKELHAIATLSSADSELQRFIYEYAVNLIAEKSVATSTYVATFELQDGVILNNEIFLQYVNACKNLSTDLLNSIDVYEEVSGVLSCDEFILDFDISKSAVLELGIQEDKYNATLKINSLLCNSEALSALRELSNVNSNLDYSGYQLVYIDYEVTNLGDAAFITPDYFCYFDEDYTIYANSGTEIAGQNTTATVEPSGTVRLHKAIVVPQSANCIYWYDKGTGVTRRISLGGE